MVEHTDWRKELERIKQEHFEEKEEHILLRDKIKEISSIMKEIDIQELETKFKMLEDFETELRTGNVHSRLSRIENEVKKSAERFNSLEADVKTNGSFSIKKSMYDEFKKIKEDIQKAEEELHNKISNMSRRSKEFAVKSKLEQKDEVKADILEHYAEKTNRISNLEKELQQVKNKIRSLSGEVELSIVDLIKRNKTEIENIEKRLNYVASPIKLEDKGENADLKLKEVIKKLDGLKIMCLTLEERILNLENSPKESIGNFGDQKIKKMLDEFKREEKKNIDAFEMEEIQLLDERLHEVNMKLNRLGDFMMNHGKQIYDLKNSFDSKIKNISEEVRNLRKIEPTIVE